MRLKILKLRGNSDEYAKVVYSFTRKWAQKMILITGSKVQVIGDELIPKNENVLFISNHQGNFDIPALMGFIDKPKGFIAKIELLKIPIVRTWMKLIGCIFLDRSQPKQALKVMNTAIEELNSGKSLVIFPEGTRSKGNKMGEFKRGSFRPAIKADITIVPITISGTYNLMEANKNRIGKGNITITISDPIKPSELSKEDLNNIHEYIKSIIESKLPVQN